MHSSITLAIAPRRRCISTRDHALHTLTPKHNYSTKYMTQKPYLSTPPAKNYLESTKKKKTTSTINASAHTFTSFVKCAHILVCPTWPINFFFARCGAQVHDDPPSATRARVRQSFVSPSWRPFLLPNAKRISSGDYCTCIVNSTEEQEAFVVLMPHASEKSRCNVLSQINLHSASIVSG